MSELVHIFAAPGLTCPQFAILLVLAAGLSAAQADTVPGAPAFLWAQQSGSFSTSTLEGAWRIAVDAAGDSFVLGAFESTADFSGTNITSYGGDYNGGGPRLDMYVAKYDPLGELLWVTHANVQGSAIATDPLGNCYVAGRYSTQLGGSVTFGTTNLPSTVGQRTAFVAHYSSNGVLRWAPAIETAPSITGPAGVAADDQGNYW